MCRLRNCQCSSKKRIACKSSRGSFLCLRRPFERRIVWSLIDRQHGRSLNNPRAKVQQHEESLQPLSVPGKQNNWLYNSWLPTVCPHGRSASTAANRRWACASTGVGPSNFRFIWSRGTTPGKRYGTPFCTKLPTPWLVLNTVMIRFGRGSVSRSERGPSGVAMRTCPKVIGRPNAAAVASDSTATESRNDSRGGFAKLVVRSGDGWNG